MKEIAVSAVNMGIEVDMLGIKGLPVGVFPVIEDVMQLFAV